MECSDIEIKISAGMDGETDMETAWQVARHIENCARCQKLATDFRAVDALLKQQPEHILRPDFPRQIMAALDICASENRGIKHRLLGFFEEFFDLLASGRMSSGTLDEFSDFPPFTIGHAYLQLMPCAGESECR